MIDRAKIILGFKHCKEPAGASNCFQCPYNECGPCREEIAGDAYELFRWHPFDEEPDVDKELIVSGGGNIWIDTWNGAGLKVFGAPAAGLVWMYAPEAV